MTLNRRSAPVQSHQLSSDSDCRISRHYRGTFARRDNQLIGKQTGNSSSVWSPARKHKDKDKAEGSLERCLSNSDLLFGSLPGFEFLLESLLVYVTVSQYCA
eukprot:gene13887-biopygen3771